MAEMTPEVWDDELCHTMRLSPETIAAALTDEAAALRAENAYLRRAFADAVGELAVSEAQAAELRAALEPLAALDAPDGCPDDEALNVFCFCRSMMLVVIVYSFAAGCGCAARARGG